MFLPAGTTILLSKVILAYIVITDSALSDALFIASCNFVNYNI